MSKMKLALIGSDNNTCIKTEGFESANHLIKLNGENLIERIIRIGRNNGISKVFWVINFHDPELEEYLSRNNFGISIKLIEQHTGSFLQSITALASYITKESVFITNANSAFIESEFSEFVTYSLLQEDADGILAITRYNDNEKPLCVAMNDDDIILKFSNSKDGYSWAAGGIYYFSPEIFKEAKSAFDSGITGIEKFLQFLIVRGYTLKGFSFSKIIKIEHAADIDIAEDLIAGNKKYLNL